MKFGTFSESPSDQLRIVLVSYLNTYPIVWGLKKIADNYHPDIILAPPAQCSQTLLLDKVGVALVPSITFLHSRLAFELLPFGIVTHKQIDTVLLVGNRPWEEWKTVFFDTDSLTSVQLAKVLFSLKKLSPRFISGIEGIEHLGDQSGALIIGDKCFTLASRFSRVYDLSKVWSELTGLPFVFALFLVHPHFEKARLKEAYLMIKEAIEVGINNLDHVIEEWCDENPRERNKKDHAYYYDYLKNKISYFLTPEALLGLREFFQKCEQQLPPEKKAGLTPEYFQALGI
jgi:predicted solute-binding protein